MIDLVEGKLDAYGLAKVLPDAEMLAAAYTAFERGARAQEALEAELARLDVEPVEVPADLERRVRAYLDENREATWDAAVRAVRNWV